MGISVGHLLVVLVIVLLVFGTKRLTSGARDLGKAVHEFKKGMHGDDGDTPRLGEDKPAPAPTEQRERDDAAR